MSHVTFPKPVKGAAWLERRERKADQKAAEDAIMRSVRVRDGHQCRWPSCEFASKKPRLEVAHLRHRGMGGNPALDRTTTANLMTLCFVHHGLLDAAERDIQALTSAGADGPCCFYRRTDTGRMAHVYTESHTGGRV